MGLFDWWKKKPKKEVIRIYEGARPGRLTYDWITSGASQDAEVATSLPRLRNRSRDLIRNNDYARGAVRVLVNNVVGKGITFQAQIHNQRGGKLNQKLNKQIEELWKTWACAEYCHTAGKLGFAEIERLIFRAVIESGEVFIRVVNKAFDGSPVPLALEIIEADQLDDTLNTANNAGASGNTIRFGIEQDEWGRPVNYHFFSQHPGDYGFGSTEAKQRYRIVPANEVIHLYLWERPGQSRGVPWLHSTMSRLRQLGGYEEAELVAARAQAAVMGFIETEADNIGDEEIQGQSTRSLEPGAIEQLNPGEKFAGFAPTRPGDGFDPFVRMMLRGVAAGCGLSYESLSRDFSNTSYSSARTALLDERDHYRIIQDWLIKNFHSKVYERWLMAAALAGAVTIPGFETNPDKFTEARWTPRGWQWVDPVKEITAYKEAIKAGLSSTTQVLAQSGLDLEQIFEERKMEIELAESYGLGLDTQVSENAEFLAAEDE